MPARVWTLRLAALMGGGTFAVHQLRYLISYGGERSAGHGYLMPLGAVVVAALLFASATALGRVARRAGERAPRFRRLWAGTTVALICVYCVQESLEGIVTGRVAGPLAHGGLVTVPVAAAIGLVIALVMRGTAAATRLPRRRPVVRPRAPVALLSLTLPAWSPPRTRSTARYLAARGPPAVAA